MKKIESYRKILAGISYSIYDPLSFFDLFSRSQAGGNGADLFC